MGSKGHHITLYPGPLSLTAQPGQRLSHALQARGLDIPLSCHNGVCGRCKARLSAGQVSSLTETWYALSKDEVAQGYILPCVATALSPLEIHMQSRCCPEDITKQTLNCRVSERQALSADIYRIVLTCPAGRRHQPHYLAGQYLLLHTEAQADPMPFSIANAPGSQQLVLHIRDSHDSASRVLLQQLQLDAQIKVELPFGDNVLQGDEQQPVILVAGGTGYAPLHALLEQALAQQPQRSLHLYWGARIRDELYLDQQIRDWQQQYPQLHYTPVLSAASEACGWQGAEGWVHSIVEQEQANLAQARIYACGPAAMIYALWETCHQQGLSADRFHSDLFSYAAPESYTPSS